MIRILLVCGSGVTSSLLAKEINSHAHKKYEIINGNVSQALRNYQKYQLLFIAPQVKFMYQEIYRRCISKNISCCLVDFDKYTVYGIQQLVERYITQLSSMQYQIGFVKDEKTGYLADLFVNKVKEEFERRKVDCHIEIMTLSQYQTLAHDMDYYIIEPKLMFYIQEDQKTFLIRTQEYQSLNAMGIVERIIDFPKELETY